MRWGCWDSVRCSACCTTRRWESSQSAHGVSLKIDRTEDMDEPTPAPMKADGTKEALHAFVLDAFRNGGLVCQAASELLGAP